MPNFFKIGQLVAKMLRFFFDFSRWRPSFILDLVWANLDHPLRVLGGLHTVHNLSSIDVVVS